MYQKAMTGIHTYLVQRSVPGNLLNIAELVPVSTRDGKTSVTSLCYVGSTFDAYLWTQRLEIACEAGPLGMFLGRFTHARCNDSRSSG